MKNIFKYICMAIPLLGLTACSADFLERIPEGQYVEETYYVSDDALDAATEPLYNRAWFDYNKRPAMAVGSLMANDAYNAYMSPEFVTFQVTALHTNLSDTWKAFYSVITMANSIIDAVETKSGPDVTEEAKERTIAEARLMRGVAYFYMLRLWNNVILFEHNDDVVENPIRPLNKPADAFRFIIEDMEYAASHLPKSPVTGKASCWAAKGMLAKVYLSRSGWEKNGSDQDASDLEKARENALDVCRNSGIELLDDYAELFKYSGNNNRESLLAMQWVENGQWGVCNTLLADIAFSPEVTGGVNVWGGGLNASTDMLNQYESGDTIRRDATFFTEGAYYDYICKDKGGYRYNGTAAPVKKGVIGGSEDNGGIHIESMNCPINTYILRLADVYLTLAEACLGNQESLNGGEGLEFFNKVRTRAKMWPKSSITLDDIIRERRVEFAMEYCNWYDMVSWYSWKPEKMLEYFNDQHRGWTASYIKVKGDDRSVGFYAENDVNTEDYDWGNNEPVYTIEVTADDIFLPYPESDVIQNPMLNEPPVDYEFND